MSSGIYAAVPVMFYTSCPYTVWRMSSCQHRMMYSLLILVVHDTIWHWWHSVMMLGNQTYFLFSWCTLWLLSGWKRDIHVRRHLFGLCCLGLQQSTTPWNRTLIHMKSFFVLSCGSGFFVLVSKNWSFTGCTLKSLSFSALDKARIPCSLACSTSSDFANWPIAMLMSLMLSWNGLIIFSSSTDRSVCNVSHFFKAVLSLDWTLPVMSATWRVSSDIAVITGRALGIWLQLLCFLLC